MLVNQLSMLTPCNLKNTALTSVGGGAGGEGILEETSGRWGEEGKGRCKSGKGN